MDRMAQATKQTLGVTCRHCEIKALFKPEVAKSQGRLSGIIARHLYAPGNNFAQVIIGTTDNWDTDDNVSSSGAKLYITTFPVGRNFALCSMRRL